MAHANVALEVVARYAFKGPGVELDRTLPLHDGESSIIAGRVRTKYRGHGLMANRPGFIRLSTDRLCIVRVYGFRRDRILEIPRGAMLGVGQDRPPVRIFFNGSHGETEIDVVMAAHVRHAGSRGTLTETTADVLAFRRAGNPASLSHIGTSLDGWLAESNR